MFNGPHICDRVDHKADQTKQNGIKEQRDKNRKDKDTPRDMEGKGKLSLEKVSEIFRGYWYTR